MSCTNCIQSGDNKSAFYRLDKASIEIRGCPEHLKKMFGRLNSFDDLLDACIRDGELANTAILSTPTGTYRNKLTERNILRLKAIAKAKEYK